MKHLTPAETARYDDLVSRAATVGALAAGLMADGSRQYNELIAYVKEYMRLRHEADHMSGQTDTSFGGLEEFTEPGGLDDKKKYG